MKKQVIVIHGADSFASPEKFLASLKNCEVSLESFLPKKEDWKNSLPKELGEEFETLVPRMPNKQNARYVEWQVWFERMLPFVQDRVILIGHSQGGRFLAKYLSENIFPRIIAGLFIVAAPHGKTEDISSFALNNNLENVIKQCGNVQLFFSQDDPVVPFSEMARYQKDLPEAQAHVFADRGHFKQEHFPEIVEEIKKI